METTQIISPVTTKEILMSTPIPQKTQSYSPIPHASVINMTMEQIDKSGLKVTEERYISAADGRKAMGFYRMSGIEDSEMGIQLIWHNSYDKSMSLKWAIGGKVFVCKNGMVSGDIGSFKRKHTGEALLDYEDAVRTYVGQAGDMFQKLVLDKERMKEIEITKRTSAELLGRMFLEEGIIQATQLNIIKRELDNPSFNYNSEGTLWQLYNHCTVALKEAHPQFHITQHMDLHNFVKAEFAI